MAKAKWINELFRRFSPATEERTSLENPQTPLSFPAEWLLDIFNGGRTDSGIRVSEMTALQVSTVFSCVNIISDGFSSLPCNVWSREQAGKRTRNSKALDSAIWEIVTDEPNPEMTAPVFFKTLVVHALLWGNAYAEIERDNSNKIINLWPRNPARTRPIRLLKSIMFQGDLLPAGTLLFETTDALMDSSTMTVAENPDTQNIGMRRIVLMEDMLHVPGLSLDGRLGQSTVWLARQAFGLALAAEKYAAKFFGNGARPAGVLTLPNKLDDKAVDNLKRSWAEAHGGENQFKVAVLETGVKYEKIAATPEEGQLLATRQHEREDIAAIFGVPSHMLAGSSEKGGKSNTEQSSIEFVLYCLHPWLVRFEKEFGRKLFKKVGRSAGKYFVKFDIRKLMYPDAAARGTFYSQGKQWGFLNTNDICELEDMNPLDDDSVGERYWQPVNMTDASKALSPGELQEQKDKAAKDLATHQDGLTQAAAKTNTNLQMKTAEQAHTHAMAQGKMNNAHAQAMAKITGTDPAAAAAAAAAAAPTGAAPVATKPTGKRYHNVTVLKATMDEAFKSGFVFQDSQVYADGDVTYRYLHPEQPEMFLIHQTREAA